MSHITITQFAQVLEHPEDELVARMKRDGILLDSGMPHRDHVRRRHFVVGELGGCELGVALTCKGQVWLARLYPPGFSFKERKLGGRK